MNSELGHRQYSESLAAYALGALPEEESARIRRHLVECRECRAEFEWLRVAADALPASVPPVALPPTLKGRVMSVVEGEAELLRAAGESADQARPRSGPRWLPCGWLRPGLVLGAAAAVLAAVLVLAFAGGAGTTRTINAQVTGPGAASLLVRGGRAELVVRGLPLPSAGHVNELWIKRGQGPPQPAGTFVVRSGSVTVERSVAQGDVVMVTVEPGQGTRAPTTRPFVTVRV